MFAEVKDVLKSYGRRFVEQNAGLDEAGEIRLDVVEQELAAAGDMVNAIYREAPQITSLTYDQLQQRLRNCQVHITAHRLAMRAAKDPLAVQEAYLTTIGWLTSLRAGDLAGQAKDAEFVAGEQPEEDITEAPSAPARPTRTADSFHTEPDA